LEPIRINIASSDYVDKKIVFFMSAVAAAIAILSIVNINLFLTNKGRISEYAIKSSSIEKKMLENKSKEEISTEKSEKILHRAILANQIIVKDVAPWSRFFERMETKVPSGIVIDSIIPSNDYQSLIIEGKARSEQKISFFMKRLKEFDFLNNSILTEFSIETGANGKFKKEEADISFRIKSDLLIQNLFEQKSYNQTIKMIMAQPEKKYK
jgi:type IV pilus assembly PilN-like protein